MTQISSCNRLFRDPKGRGSRGTGMKKCTNKPVVLIVMDEHNNSGEFFYF